MREPATQLGAGGKASTQGVEPFRPSATVASGRQAGRFSLNSKQRRGGGAILRPGSFFARTDRSMRLGEARDRVPLKHFLQQGALGGEDNPLEAVPRLAEGHLLAAVLEDRAHLAIAGHPALQVVDRDERDERRG